MCPRWQPLVRILAVFVLCLYVAFSFAASVGFGPLAYGNVVSFWFADLRIVENTFILLAEPPSLKNLASLQVYGNAAGGIGDSFPRSARRLERRGLRSRIVLADSRTSADSRKTSTATSV
jgi:hypothetical protein